MKKFVKIFVGSNNETNELEKEKILIIINKNHQGFSFYEIEGAWQGKIEKTLTIEIFDDFETIKKTMEILKEKLKQEAIAYVDFGELKFI